MEIDLRKLIHDAIQDREALNKRILQGTIDIENEIIDILKKRYEKERDQLTELAEAKREALNEELSLLDEQLNARKKLNEEEDRAKKLAELEAQLARVSADPTRKKEELELREQIAELREEIAWELAEEEVEAQKKSIESQIESIDDYIEYVEDYYEELLSNPRKLMEEMQELLTRTTKRSWPGSSRTMRTTRKPQAPPGRICAAVGRRCWTTCEASLRHTGTRWMKSGWKLRCSCARSSSFFFHSSTYACAWSAPASW